MSLRSPWSTILWDVDGTIVDASDGILRRLSITLTHFGRPAPVREELAHWIGPPMFDSFQAQGGMTPAEATEAVSYYRVLGKGDGYTTGATLFPGVAELIAEAHAAGIPQAIASSKPEIQVRALMQHFELTEYFDVIVGATLDERTLSKKSDIIAEALRQLQLLGLDTSRAVMIGDRHHDIEGAAANALPTIFVRWGFSWPHEVDAAERAVDDTTELRPLLLCADDA